WANEHAVAALFIDGTIVASETFPKYVSFRASEASRGTPSQARSGSLHSLRSVGMTPSKGLTEFVSFRASEASRGTLFASTRRVPPLAALGRMTLSKRTH